MLEYDGGAQKRRHEQGHELTEHMAERHQRHKPQRMKALLIFSIRIDAVLERLEIGQKIAVRQDHAARLGRRAGGEQYLCDMFARQRFIGKG